MKRIVRANRHILQSWGKLALQAIGEALFYYKIGQKLLQIGAAHLSKNVASVFANWDMCYELGKKLLQIRAELQIRAIITY